MASKSFCGFFAILRYINVLNNNNNNHNNNHNDGLEQGGFAAWSYPSSKASCLCPVVEQMKTRRALGRAHCSLPPTKVSDGSVNKTILKPRLAASAGRQYVYVGFSRRKIPRSSAYTISEKVIRFRHPDYNPDRTQKLISSSMSRHLSTCNISSKSMHAFLSNLDNSQRDKQTNERGQKRLSPPLSEIMIKVLGTSCVDLLQTVTIYRPAVTSSLDRTHFYWFRLRR